MTKILAMAFYLVLMLLTKKIKIVVSFWYLTTGQPSRHPGDHLVCLAMYVHHRASHVVRQRTHHSPYQPPQTGLLLLTSGKVMLVGVGLIGLAVVNSLWIIHFSLAVTKKCIMQAVVVYARSVKQSLPRAVTEHCQWLS